MNKTDLSNGNEDPEDTLQLTKIELPRRSADGGSEQEFHLGQY